MRNKKLSLMAIFILGIMLIVTGCGNSDAKATSGSQKSIPIRFGIDAGTFSVAFHVAEEKGFFAKHGIEPKLTVFANGIGTLNAAVSNQVDVGVAMDFAALSRFSTGDLKILSFLQNGKPENSKVIVRDGINSPEELKGKSFGLSKGTVGEYIVFKYFERYNIKQDEVKKQGLGSSPEVLAAFQRGDIQGAFFGGLYRDKALQVPGAKIIGSQADIPFGARGFLLVKDKLLKEKPEAGKRILLALDEAVKWIDANPEAAAEIEAKALKVPKDDVLTQLKDLNNDIRLSNEDVKILQDVYDFSVKNKLIKGGFDLKDKIVTEPLKQALPSKLTYNPDDLK